MTDVVEHSLQHLSESDITAIARYLKSLGAKDPHQAAFSVDDATAKALWKGDDSATGQPPTSTAVRRAIKPMAAAINVSIRRCAVIRWCWRTIRPH